MMEWISVKDRLPPLSYVESDNEDDLYEAHYCLVFCPERPGIMCVAFLVKEQDETKWNFGELAWELCIPGEGGYIEEVNFDIFTHWMSLPKPPER